MYRAILLASFLFCLSFHSGAAQQPTTTQRNAIRSSCRSDFIAKCSGVEPGGKAALECLERNHDSLSASCKTAIDGVATKPAAAPPSAETPAAAESVPPATTTPPEPSAEQASTTTSQDEQLKAVRRACTLDDIAAHCSWIAPTSPELVLCLRANATDLSPGCKAVIGPSAPKAATTTPAEPAEPAQPVEPAKKPSAHVKATAAAMPGAPTAAQTAAIRSACRSDFMAHCSGVQPGGSAALQCLVSNSAKLSPGCRTAVTAVGSGAVGASATPSAATPAVVAPAVAPLRPRPFIIPQRRLSILRICRTDVATLCGDTQPGGGRFIDCLGAHAAQLSPACYDAVARVNR
jgi:hypothetical protein